MFTDVEKLTTFLEIDEEKKKSIDFKPKFPLRLPYRIAKKIKKNDLNDPLFKQFVPTIDEKKIYEGFTDHPVEDKKFQKGKLLKKYEKRALLLTGPGCGIHCRFCFRKNFPYTPDEEFQQEISIIQKDKTLEEIILSGTDPLTSSKLKTLMHALNGIDHVKRIRIHSRLLIGCPELCNDDFLSLLKNSPKQLFFVQHINHPAELDDDLITALKKIKKLGIPIFTQTVLLKDINDHVKILEHLFTGLINHGIIPYYLHQLDKVSGSSHFEVEVEKGLKIIQALRKKLPGYAMPEYVQEIPFKKSKTPLYSIKS